MDERTIRWILQMCADGINPALLFSVLSELPLALSSATPQSRSVSVGRAVRFCVAGCVARSRAGTSPAPAAPPG